MRVSTQQLSNTMQYHMSSTTSSMNRTLMQLNSGKAILKPSDDTLASLQIMGLEDQNARLDAYTKNIHSARNALDMTESVLGNMNDALNRARDLVLAIGGLPVQEGGQNQDIAAYAQELSALVEELADMGNTRSATGEYIFAGTGGDQPAVALDEATGDYQLQGGEVREAQISDAQSVELGVALKDVLGSGDDNTLNALSRFVEVATDPNVTEPQMDAAIAGALETIDGAMDRVNQSLTGVGASLNSLKMAEDSQSDRKTFNETMQGGLENVDVARATMNFAMEQQQLMASQKAYSMVNSTSLFDYV